MEESDAWWVYQNQEPMVTSLAAHPCRGLQIPGDFKRNMESAVCALCPLNHGSQQSRKRSTFAKLKLRISIPPKKFTFFRWVAEQIALAFDNALHFDAAQAITAAVC